MTLSSSHLWKGREYQAHGRKLIKSLQEGRKAILKDCEGKCYMQISVECTQVQILRDTSKVFVEHNLGMWKLLRIRSGKG